MDNLDKEVTLRRALPKDVLTALPNGERIRKDDIRMEACGTLDELNSHLGLLITQVPVTLVHELQEIQVKLFAIGAVVVGIVSPNGLPDSVDIKFLTKRIDDFTDKCGHSTSFILPGGSHPAAQAHICRTVCRRAERLIVATENYDLVPYINRLSTYLFYLARYLNLFYGFSENYI